VASDNEFGVYPERNSGWDTLQTQFDAEASASGSASTANTFARLREREVQEAVANGGDVPAGYFSPEFPSSTRVEAYRYVPNDYKDSSDGGLGTLFVRFIKNGDAWAYHNIPKAVYDAFNTPGVSKGKFVNTTLNPLTNNGNRASDADMLYFNGF